MTEKLIEKYEIKGGDIVNKAINEFVIEDCLEDKGGQTENVITQNKIDCIPVWKRYALTITEAANYYHIGEAKLRILVDNHPDADFAIQNGNRILIKRKKFEQFLDEATVL